MLAVMPAPLEQESGMRTPAVMMPAWEQMLMSLLALALSTPMMEWSLSTPPQALALISAALESVSMLRWVLSVAALRLPCRQPQEQQAPRAQLGCMAKKAGQLAGDQRPCQSAMR